MPVRSHPDYGPGCAAEAQFKKTSTAAGGEIIGEVRVPVKNPDRESEFEALETPDSIGEEIVRYYVGQFSSL